MEQIVDIAPAFDLRNKDPKKNYGIHGCDLRMVLKGELGAVQFVLFTGWHLPNVTKERLGDIQEKVISLTINREKNYSEEFPYGGIASHVKSFFTPLPADLGYHSPKPMYKGQSFRKNCPYIKNKKCYYDGSGLNAHRIYEILLKKGSNGVWKELKKYYKQTFGKLK